MIRFDKKTEREITINFPLYSSVADLYIGLDETAVLKKSLGYKHKKPIVFYGSSITQGGCASRPGNAYESIISRALQTDYINLGFSGNAKAEDEIAQYIKDLDMSVFIYDYDHNAPNLKHLEDTHQRMFSLSCRALNTGSMKRKNGDWLLLGKHILTQLRQVIKIHFLSMGLH